MPERVNEAKWIESRKRWQINVQKDGERRTFTSSTEGKKGKVEAEKKADKWLDYGINNDKIRFGKLYADFLEQRKLLFSTSDYTSHEYIGRIWLSPRLKNKRVLSITEQMWQDCVNDAFKAGRSKKTLQDIRGSITAFIKYVRKRGIKITPLEGLTIPREAYSKERKILQPDHLKILFSTDTITKRGKEYKEFYIYAFRFMALTGIRPGELCGLETRDIKDRVCHIRRSYNRFEEITPGKNDNAVRNFYVMDLVNDVIAAQKSMLKSKGIITPFIFPDDTGDRLDSHHLYKMWKYYANQYNIPGSPYEMRHTMISVAKADVPEELLKPMVGHSKSMDTFGVYGHEITGDMQRAANILNDVFSGLISK